MEEPAPRAKRSPAAPRTAAELRSAEDMPLLDAAGTGGLVRVDSPEEIPDKLYFRIGEAAALVGVKPHVLRFWETQFPGVSPKKSGTGQRLYRRKDVEQLVEVRRLLHDQRFTIEGARRHLQDAAKRTRQVDKAQRGLFLERPGRKPKEPKPAPAPKPQPVPAAPVPAASAQVAVPSSRGAAWRQTVDEVRQELRALLEMLER